MAEMAMNARCCKDISLQCASFNGSESSTLLHVTRHCAALRPNFGLVSVGSRSTAALDEEGGGAVARSSGKRAVAGAVVVYGAVKLPPPRPKSPEPPVLLLPMLLLPMLLLP